MQTYSHLYTHPLFTLPCGEGSIGHGPEHDFRFQVGHECLDHLSLGRSFGYSLGEDLALKHPTCEESNSSESGDSSTTRELYSQVRLVRSSLAYKRL